MNPARLSSEYERLYARLLGEVAAVRTRRPVQQALFWPKVRHGRQHHAAGHQ